MALLVFWLLAYLFIQAIGGDGPKTYRLPQHVIDAYNAGPVEEDPPIPVEWELLPAIDEATQWN